MPECPQNFMEASSNSKGVQRATPFAGVWGVPKFSFYPAAAGGKAT